MRILGILMVAVLALLVSGLGDAAAVPRALHSHDCEHAAQPAPDHGKSTEAAAIEGHAHDAGHSHSHHGVGDHGSCCMVACGHSFVQPPDPGVSRHSPTELLAPGLIVMAWQHDVSPPHRPPRNLG